MAPPVLTSIRSRRVVLTAFSLHPLHWRLQSMELFTDAFTLDLGCLMVSWRALAQLSDDDLATHDIAEINLACAAGLPGIQQIDVARCLKTLDEWAQTVKRWTQAAYIEFFLADPTAFNNSEAHFKVVALITALFRHCGVRYDPSKIELVLADAGFEIHESFVFGVINGPGGTCASLPVVYAAVGRRLGYPIRIVKTRRHVFARWDDPTTGERINFEGGNDGYGIHLDERYRHWPVPITPEAERNYGYLESLTPRRELASFLGQRAFVLTDFNRYREAVETFIAAANLEPDKLTYRQCAVQWLAVWKKQLQAEFSIGFPPPVEVLVPTDPRRWPWMDEQIVRAKAYLQATEDCRRSTFFERQWWNPAPTSMASTYESPLRK